MSADSVKLNTDITAVLIKTPLPKRTQLPSLISIPITYVGRQVNLNSVSKVEDHEPKSDSHSDGSLVVREARSPIENQASTERAKFDKSFEHIFRKYDIDSCEVSPCMMISKETGSFRFL